MDIVVQQAILKHVMVGEDLGSADWVLRSQDAAKPRYAIVIWRDLARR